jgi:hypothetical protein
MRPREAAGRLDAMLSPQVIELRRGSAHGAPLRVGPAAPAAATNRRLVKPDPARQGGQRWNSVI